MENVLSTEISDTVTEVASNDLFATHAGNMEVLLICVLFGIGVLCGLVIAKILFNKVRY